MITNPSMSTQPSPTGTMRTVCVPTDAKCAWKTSWRYFVEEVSRSTVLLRTPSTNTWAFPLDVYRVAMKPTSVPVKVNVADFRGDDAAFVLPPKAFDVDF